jgi:hypothetical protein
MATLSTVIFVRDYIRQRRHGYVRLRIGNVIVILRPRQSFDCFAQKNYIWEYIKGSCQNGEETVSSKDFKNPVACF